VLESKIGRNHEREEGGCGREGDQEKCYAKSSVKFLCAVCVTSGRKFLSK
jgi:hypothetical protein